MLPRQRIRARAGLSVVALALTVIFSLALLWYGLMVVLAGFGVKPAFINDISGYRTAFDFLSGLGPDDLDSRTRIILAGAGLLTFVVFGYLALRALPTPYLAREDLDLPKAERGALVVEARALERLAEIASCQHDSVFSATARATADRLELDVGLRRASLIGTDLAQIRDRVRAALGEHELPARPVDVTLADFDANQTTGVLE